MTVMDITPAAIEDESSGQLETVSCTDGVVNGSDGR